MSAHLRCPRSKRDVDTAKTLLRFVHVGTDLLGIGHVRGKARNGAADASGGPADPARGRFDAGPRAIDEQHRGAFAREQRAGSPTDAAGAAGDDGDLALQACSCGIVSGFFRETIFAPARIRHQTRDAPTAAQEPGHPWPGFASDQYSRTPLDLAQPAGIGIRRRGSGKEPHETAGRELVGRLHFERLVEPLITAPVAERRQRTVELYERLITNWYDVFPLCSQ